MSVYGSYYYGNLAFSTGEVLDGAATVNASASISASALGTFNAASVVSSSSTIACVGTKVRLGGATSSASSTIATSGLKIQDCYVNIYALASCTSDSDVVFTGSAQMTSTSTTAVIEYTRIRSGTSAVSVTSGITTIGREKWELITDNNVTWTQIAA
tara:strand:- start:1643 stop:2113 length:471 start_codon:yes stop_codon:yes gene_type:complete